jgi:hypothetical protein
MGVNMQNIEVLFIVSFAVCAIFMVVANALSYLLFKSLKKSYASYYKSIGEPSVMIIAKLTDTEDDFRYSYVRSWKTSLFIYRLVFKGIPESFPKNVKLRKLTHAVRIVSVFALVSWVTVVVVGYFFYRSTS